MTTAAEKMAAAKIKIESRSEEARQIGATYKFVLEGEGGGSWLVNLKDAVGVEPSDGEAECTIKMSGSDFVELLEGRADGQQLFFSGKLTIDGEMALATKLQKLTELLQ